MKKGFAKLILGAAATLCIASPGYSSYIVSFTGQPNNLGSVTVDPGTEQVTGLSAVPFADLSLTNTTTLTTTNYSLDSATLGLNAGVLTLSGEVFNSTNTVALPGLGTIEPLVTIVLKSALANLGTSSQLNITNANASAVTINAQLLADLTVPTPISASLMGLGVIGSGTNFTYTVDSDTLTLGAAQIPTTPEPVSYVVCGSGLAALLLLKWRKSADNAVQNRQS